MIPRRGFSFFLKIRYTKYDYLNAIIF